MAQISRVGEVLLVSGQDVHIEDFDVPLRHLLLNATAAQSPVRSGTHDFWICFTLPVVDNVGCFFHGDGSTTPRPLRGILNLDLPGGLDDSEEIRQYLRDYIEEAGHHWLVPDDLKFEAADGSLVGLPNNVDFARCCNEETEFGGPIILGKQDAHWSPFMDGDGSPMEGVNQDKIASFPNGISVWDCTPYDAGMVTSTNLLPFRAVHFNDLDLFIMGAMTARQTYEPDHLIRWIEPKLTAPLEYFAGLTLNFSKRDFVHFGFDQDHRHLKVIRYSEVNLHQTRMELANIPVCNLLQISGANSLLAEKYDIESAGLELRIVRVKKSFIFQYLRKHKFVAGKNRFEPLAKPQWETIAELTTIQQPLSVGGLTATYKDQQCFAETAFKDMNLTIGRNTVSLGQLPPGRNPLAPQTAFYLETPGEGAIVRMVDHELRIAAPRSKIVNGEAIGLSAFEHTTRTDLAPKVLIELPTADFIFHSHVRVHRAFLSPWSYGRACGKRVWGKEKSVSVLHAKLSQLALSKQAPPPNATYKIAFIMIGETDDELRNSVFLQIADGMRAYFELAFAEATHQTRFMDTRLD